jgi:hypothetical protein
MNGDPFRTYIREKDIEHVSEDEIELLNLQQHSNDEIREAATQALIWWQELQRLLHFDKAEFVVERVLNKRLRNVS